MGLSTPRAVIFDLDGTLLDTLADISNAMNFALTAHALPTHTLEAYRGFIGKGLEQLVAAALPEDRELLKASVLARFRERYGEQLVVETRLYPGIFEMLDGLVARRVPMAILSNKPDAPTQTLVKQLLGRWPFVEVRGERSGVPRKPDPQSALALAQVMGLSPQDCAFVGDSAVDIQTALGAGMMPIGVLWGFRGPDELAAAGATEMLANPAELVPLLIAPTTS